ncbi:MAG: rhodanese-like domain-containing protein [Thermodesulfobacteriota bacterium]
MKAATRVTALAMLLALILPGTVLANLKSGEDKVLAEMRSAIPGDRLKNIEDLHAKWQQIQAGRSKAYIIDIRSQAEFDAGHIIGSSNIDSGHAYDLPKKIKDSKAEIWVFCRTKQRASYFTGLLYRYGYKNVYLAEGGIKAWAARGYPLGNKYLGEFVVTTYHKKLKEDFWSRENK